MLKNLLKEHKKSFSFLQRKYDEQTANKIIQDIISNPYKLFVFLITENEESLSVVDDETINKVAEYILNGVHYDKFRDKITYYLGFENGQIKDSKAMFKKFKESELTNNHDINMIINNFKHRRVFYDKIMVLFYSEKIGKRILYRYNNQNQITNIKVTDEPYSKETEILLDEPVEWLNLSDSAFNILKDCNVSTINELLMLKSENLLAFYPRHKTTIKELSQVVDWLREKFSGRDNFQVAYSMQDDIDCLNVAKEFKQLLNTADVRTIEDLLKIRRSDLKAKKIYAKESAVLMKIQDSVRRHILEDGAIKVKYTLETSVESLGLSDSLENILKVNGAKTVENLLNISIEDLKAFRLYENEIEEFNRIIAEIKNNLVQKENGKVNEELGDN